ncbi:Arylsulfatase I [Papilio machaon]|uniref:Arylsulfatase I n=1 Tax=Papilio machaon TaxID=76193 RepID=A0A194RFZ6_PAPMA|nr:Arylsulfatase I [Papilio machaon]
MTRVLCLIALATLCRASDRPHIILIIADDLLAPSKAMCPGATKSWRPGFQRPLHPCFKIHLKDGWNDVSFHGSNQIPTPNIDALAWSGLVLNNYYVTPICTPSRAALMTGKYPIHTGFKDLTSLIIRTSDDVIDDDEEDNISLAQLAQNLRPALSTTETHEFIDVDQSIAICAPATEDYIVREVQEENENEQEDSEGQFTVPTLIDGLNAISVLRKIVLFNEEFHMQGNCDDTLIKIQRMQHGVIYGTEPRGLPLSEKLLPEYLRELGYRTHLVGKWHLGSYKRDYLPLNRGFDTHLGFWTGKIDLYDHTSFEFGSWGFDFRRGFEVAHDLFGQYATDVYTNEAVRVIMSHNASAPLFLTVAHSAVHSGNPAEFLRAPDSTIDKFAHIRPYQRQKFAAMVSKLDESVGKVVQALQQRNMLEHSIILFTTDNGGAAAGFNDNAASNYPLRGVKNTLWEGGVRGAGVLWSSGLRVSPRVVRQRLHLVDWLPTLLAAAGANYSCDCDGMNQWEALSGDLPSPRTSVLHNIDDIYGSAAITVDQWKLHKGTNYNGAWDDWYGPSGEGEGGEYAPGQVRDSDAGRALQHLGLLPADNTILALRKEATLRCNASVTPIPCRPLAAPCLFNIEEDPCERRNLADLEPVLLRRMLVELDLMNRTSVPALVRAREPRADPRLWGHLYTNFGDYLPLSCDLDPTQRHCHTKPYNFI